LYLTQNNNQSLNSRQCHSDNHREAARQPDSPPLQIRGAVQRASPSPPASRPQPRNGPTQAPAQQSQPAPQRHHLRKVQTGAHLHPASAAATDQLRQQEREPFPGVPSPSGSRVSPSASQLHLETASATTPPGEQLLQLVHRQPSRGVWSWPGQQLRPAGDAPPEAAVPLQHVQPQPPLLLPECRDGQAGKTGAEHLQEH